MYFSLVRDLHLLRARRLSVHNERRTSIAKSKEHTKKCRRGTTLVALANRVPIYACDHLQWCIITCGKSATERTRKKTRESWKRIFHFHQQQSVVRWFAQTTQSASWCITKPKASAVRTYCANDYQINGNLFLHAFWISKNHFPPKALSLGSAAQRFPRKEEILLLNFSKQE